MNSESWLNMTTQNSDTPMDQLADTNWGQAKNPVIKPRMITRGTLLTLDMARTRLLCEEVLGFECICNGKVMYCRHRSNRDNSAPYWILEIHQAETNPTPQNMSNHWGIWVQEISDVDAAYELLSNNLEKYGIARIQKPRFAHQGRLDYSMYFEDTSGNWWEIDRQPVEEEFIKYFSSGDWDQRGPTADRSHRQ